MKYFAYIICIYILALTVLPTVRAIKHDYIAKCQSSEEKDCEKSKFIMNLNFSPIQFINELSVLIKSSLHLLISNSTVSLEYNKIFIDNFQNNFWNPPKIYFK